MEKPGSTIGLVQYLALAYDLVEAFFAVLFGVIANSPALMGFGFNSLAEFGIGLSAVKRLKNPGYMAGDGPDAGQSNFRPPVLRAVIFFILGSYILIRSLKMLLTSNFPAVSRPGILIAVISLLITPLFALWGFKEPAPVKPLSFQNIRACLLLSLGLLIGLGLNLAGIWQADPLMGLVSVGFLYKKTLDGLLRDAT